MGTVQENIEEGSHVAEEYDDSTSEGVNSTMATDTQTLTSGKKVTVYKKLRAALIAAKMKEEHVTTLSAEELDKIAIESTSYSELQELSDAILNGSSFKGLSSEEIQDFNKSYMETTYAYIDENPGKGYEKGFSSSTGLASLLSDKGNIYSKVAMGAAGILSICALGYGTATMKKEASRLEEKGSTKYNQALEKIQSNAEAKQKAEAEGKEITPKEKPKIDSGAGALLTAKGGDRIYMQDGQIKVKHNDSKTYLTDVEAKKAKAAEAEKQKEKSGKDERFIAEK